MTTFIEAQPFRGVKNNTGTDFSFSDLFRLCRQLTLADCVDVSHVHAMWSFLWHMRGSVPVHDDIPDDLLIERIARLLNGQQKPITQRTPTAVEFFAPIRWSIAPTNRNLSLGWSAMRDFDRGAFWIEQVPEGRLLRYDLRRLRLFSLILIAALFFFIVFGLRGYPAFAGIFGIFGVIWLYVPSVLLARMRIPRKIQAAIRYGY